MLLGGMSSSRSPRPLPRNTHHSAPRRPTMARAGEWGRAVLHGQVPEHPTPQAAGAQHFAMDAGEDVGEAPLLEVLPQERVQQRTVEQIVDPCAFGPVPSRRCAADGGIVGGLSRLVSHLSISVLPNRLSKYPRSCVHPALLPQSSPVILAGAVCASWSRRQNSWWKCRRLSPILPCCSRLWNRTWTFQFVIVEGETSIFKVFFPDRVQQRRLLRRSLTILLLVEVFKVFVQDRVHS